MHLCIYNEYEYAYVYYMCTLWLGSQKRAADPMKLKLRQTN